MIHDFQSGDLLIFQLESGYGLLKVLAVDGNRDEPVWHVAVYSDLFLDAEMADNAVENDLRLGVAIPHVALTNRAFESTQVAKVNNKPVADSEKRELEIWTQDVDREVSDRSVRLLLGLR